jgi:hypothetical protein
MSGPTLQNSPTATTLAPAQEPQLSPALENLAAQLQNVDAERALTSLNQTVDSSLRVMGIRDIIDLKGALVSSGLLSPQQQEQASYFEQQIDSNLDLIKALLFSQLTGSAVAGLGQLSELSPEQQEHARLALNQMLERASLEELEDLASKLGMDPEALPSSQPELVAALQKSNLLEAALVNPDILESLGQILAQSQELPPEAQALLQQALEGVQKGMEGLKLIIASGIIAAVIARELERRSKLPKPRTETESEQNKTPHPGTDTEHLPLLRRELEVFSEPVYTDWKKIEKIELEAQDVRRREEIIARKEEEKMAEDRRLHKLQAYVDQLLRENPGLVGTIAEVSLRQENFLSEIGRPTPKFVNDQFSSTRLG